MKKKTLGIILTLAAAAAALIAIPLKNKAVAQSNTSELPKELAQAPALAPTATSTQPDIGIISESFGHLIAKHLQNPSLQLDMERMIKGMRDELSGIASPMTDEEYEQAIAAIQENIVKELSEKNLCEANAFLEKNCLEEGVISLDSKLQYSILKEGQGNEVTMESTPLIHYTGKLLDGTVFGNSYEHQDPIPLPIAHTIPGFSKGLVGMKEGEKRRLFIHPDLAYGVNGQLPPNSLLIFEVEVVKNEGIPEIVSEMQPVSEIKIEETAEISQNQ